LEKVGILPDVTGCIVINLNPGSDGDRKNSDTDSQSYCDNSETASEYNNKVCLFYEGTLSVPTQGVPQVPT
jgi:hypothetical protein